MKLQEIISSVKEYNPTADVEAIQAAHAFAQRYHQGQTRGSGEPYITHVTEVAHLATRLRLDVPSLVAALLHDTVEDTDAHLDDIEERFGLEVAELVDGVTKLSKVKSGSRTEQQSENFRKMLLAMAKDIRVLLVKLCDRMHNMRTLQFLSEARRSRISQETIDIYAPLAHRLGIHWMKSELEDLSFRYLKPELYERIKKNVNAKRREREAYIEKVVKVLDEELEKSHVEAHVSGRPKHFYSIYQKMERQAVEFEEIYDLIGFRIIVDTTMACYSALGVVHAAWKPIPGRFKDYIAMPKPNQYQSLHTTVIGPEGARVEIQIRTTEMHDVAERGIAAHWQYKEGGSKEVRTPTSDAGHFSWLRDLIESEQAHRDPYEFLSTIKEDLYSEEVFVFTPKGDLVSLASNSTPIDFAYQIHSEIGDHCSGAKVNGRQVPLDYLLQNGDTVEIQTSLSQVPNKDWLNNVATSRARQRVRAWIKGEERTRSVSVGKELLTKDLRKVGLYFNRVLKKGQLAEVSRDLHYGDVDTLLAEVGYGKLPTRRIVEALLPNESNLDERLSQDESALQKIFQRAARAFKDGAGIKINGLDDVVFRFARCCDPLPGEEIVGYVTRGRGVAIHKRTCPQALSFDSRRLIEVSWDREVECQRRIVLRVLSLDKLGLLAKMTQAISTAGANIAAAYSTVNPDGKAVNTFEINVLSSSQMDAVTRSLERVDGVLRVDRQKRKPESLPASSDSGLN